MVKVNWTEQALEDLDAICTFIARDSPYFANIFANEVFSKTENLKMFPLSGRIVLELNQKEIREIIYGNYRIIYRILPDEIEILTIHHSAMILDKSKLK